MLLDCEGAPEAIVIATGSEVGLAVEAAQELNEQGARVRVVSMPCTDVFEAQDEEYRESVLPRVVKARVAVEAGVTDYWFKYVGLSGKVVGLDTFGKSAPAEEVFKHFGIDTQNIVKAVNDVLSMSYDETKSEASVR